MFIAAIFATVATILFAVSLTAALFYMLHFHRAMRILEAVLDLETAEQSRGAHRKVMLEDELPEEFKSWNQELQFGSARLEDER